jgi:hypothetical protein
MDQAERDRILEAQLRMTPSTWAQMRSHGATERTPLTVELVFFAPSEGQARALATELSQRHGFESSVADHEGTFSVEARTPSQCFSESGLLQLTRDMCELGARHDSAFDGWGAQLPDTDPPARPWWKLW